jgi:hypothetical protein
LRAPGFFVEFKAKHDSNIQKYFFDLHSVSVAITDAFMASFVFQARFPEIRDHYLRQPLLNVLAACAGTCRCIRARSTFA